MKQNFTHVRYLVTGLIMLIVSQVKAQPDYVFTGGVLESGTDLEIGAVYRFKDVKPGFDGIITIKDMTGGMTLAKIDGPSGFDEAFQPYINVAPYSKGYVEFQLDFVETGTNIPAIMTEVPLTAIDIDGWAFPDDKLYEFDEFEMTPSYYEQYDLLGNDLVLSHTAGWAEAMNTNAITYDGIDTVQKNVMFTAVHGNVSTVRFRVGAIDNSSSGMQRLRSVYFKKFYFNTGLLPAPMVKSFNGVSVNNVVQISWELVGGSNVKSVVVEKSSDTRSFTAIDNLNVNYSEMAQKQSTEDPYASAAATYYRLRLTDIQGRVSYSNVLMVKGKSGGNTGFKVYPNLVQSSTTINMVSEVRQEASIRIIDFNGRTVKQSQVQLSAGTNNMQVNDLDKLSVGQYVVVLDVPGNRYSQQIVKR
jgi:hypothetical protein